RYASAVDNGRNVMGMGTLHLEGDDCTLVPGGADDFQRIDLAQTVGGIREQRFFVGPDRSTADRVDVIDGRPQADRLYDRRGAGFELMGRGAIGNAILKHTPDRPTAARRWRHA